MSDRDAIDQVSSNRPHRGYETQDVSVRAILCWTVALVIVFACVAGAVRGLFARLATRTDSQRASTTANIGSERGPTRDSSLLRRYPVEPRLEGIIPTDEMRFWPHRHPPDVERQVGYQWVDRSKGLVTIPISRAMQLLISEHRLPVRANPYQSQAVPGIANSGRLLPDDGHELPDDETQNAPASE